MEYLVIRHLFALLAEIEVVLDRALVARPPNRIHPTVVALHPGMHRMVPVLPVLIAPAHLCRGDSAVRPGPLGRLTSIAVLAIATPLLPLASHVGSSKVGDACAQSKGAQQGGTLGRANPLLCFLHDGGRVLQRGSLGGCRST